MEESENDHDESALSESADVFDQSQSTTNPTGDVASSDGTVENGDSHCDDDNDDTISLLSMDSAGVFSTSAMADDLTSVVSTVQTDEFGNSLLTRQIKIRNRQRRTEAYIKFRREQRKQKIKLRKLRQKQRAELGDDAPPIAKAITIDNRREKEDTMVAINDPEVLLDEQSDEMSAYFRRETCPKILITTSDRPRSRTSRFLKQLSEALPNSFVFYRRALDLKKIIPQCVAKDYTDLIVVNEDRKTPNGMLICHLPDGPTAHFKISNLKLRKEIRNSTNPSEHKPEVILNNFGTRLGHTVARMIAALYPHNPEFKGRQVVTFHNQRDFIFFRHHRYIFRNEKRVGLQEIGPRFTLKLRSIQRGTFDSKFGEYEWIHKPHEMDTSRRKFHL